MEYIFHEKQDGLLCAQHALNGLLQGAYFTAVDLSEIGRNLDETERKEIGTEAFAKISENGSTNLDNTGFFSIQVINSALQIWNLEARPFKSECNEIARAKPEQEVAFICNLNQHWYTYRKFPKEQWINLDSMLKEPQVISKTYLALLLEQISREGYSIFVIKGKLPDCVGDQMLEHIILPVTKTTTNNLYTTEMAENRSVDPNDNNEEYELIQALQQSRNEEEARRREEEERNFEEAIKASLLSSK